jgi:hypothetical protein
MRFPIRPGKVTCAGVVAILMVLPNSIWRGPDASVPPARTSKVERIADSPRRSVKFRKVPRRAIRAKGVAELKLRSLD